MGQQGQTNKYVSIVVDTDNPYKKNHPSWCMYT